MESLNWHININECLLALGPESDGNFSVFYQKMLYRSDSFGDLLNEENFQKFTQAITKFLKKNKVKPDIILTDLHPLYKTTSLGESLSKTYKAKQIRLQHHISHVFSAIGDKMINNKNYKLQVFAGGLRNIVGIACDGTGYGTDGKIWGGELFKINGRKEKVKSIERIGYLENQILIGGDLAVKEPARMLISILNKFLPKDKACLFVKKYYSKNEFEVLYSQLKQNFNCQETSSAGRVLDAVSVLLGFCGNVRKYKHGPAIALENSSTIPYTDLRPVVTKSEINSSRERNSNFILETTPLFEYLVKNVKKDKHRLAATAQLYMARGLYEIIKKELRVTGYGLRDVFFAGGIANNKIIASYLELKGVYAGKKIPRGDAGVSFGQIIYYLLANPRN
ncbi:MAG: hypothetical protein CO141_01115 [Candidatus Moranbacteria bacterium CG_4_9_14_3_um_filter_42_9]|nr:MAG: hypothetical protein CO141_01115 [Candidatus Moranbacteria bacterium CG_4_9_14_3_um_filter_42_9]